VKLIGFWVESSVEFLTKFACFFSDLLRNIWYIRLILLFFVRSFVSLSMKKFSNTNLYLVPSKSQPTNSFSQQSPEKSATELNKN